MANTSVKLVFSADLLHALRSCGFAMQVFVCEERSVLAWTRRDLGAQVSSFSAF